METAPIAAWTLQNEIPIPEDVQPLLAVVGGGLVERLSAGSPPEHRIEIRSDDGESTESSVGPEPHLSDDEAARVRTKLEAIGGRWAPWPTQAPAILFR